MRFLIMGGTLFLGRAIVEHALGAGHDVTLFNRGRTNPDLFPGVETVVGDRDGGLAALRNRMFEGVIDTSAYFPRQVRSVVEALDAKIEHYSFVSSCSVYADASVRGVAEQAELASVDDPSVETLGENYGGFKALCEQALDDALPGRVHHVRAGLIVGPHDNTGRFSYWVERIAAGGVVLAPEPREQPVQFIDVRDLAAWVLDAAQSNVTGGINAVGPPGEHTMATLLAAIQSGTRSDAILTWVAEEFLVEQDVSPWQQLPLWLPPASVPTHAGFMSRDSRLAQKLGLRTRPLDETISATLANLETTSEVPTKDFGNILPRAGLDPEREAELLAAWPDWQASHSAASS